MLYVNPLESPALMRLDAEARKTVREKQAVQEFERFFLYQFLREMRKTIPPDPLLGRSSQQDFVEDMMDDFMAGKMADSGQFGMAKQMLQQLHSSAARTAPIKETGPSGPPGGRVR